MVGGNSAVHFFYRPKQFLDQLHPGYSLPEIVQVFKHVWVDKKNVTKSYHQTRSGTYYYHPGASAAKSLVPVFGKPTRNSSFWRDSGSLFESLGKATHRT